MLKTMVQNKVVDINRIMLNNYLKLNLDERELVVVMHLFLLLEKNKNLPSMSFLKSRTTLGINEVSAILNSLVEKNYLSINLDSKTKKEIYSLEPMLEVITTLFEEEKRREMEKEVESIEKQIIDIFQTEYARSLSPIEMEIICDWVLEKETIDTIKEAMLEANKMGKKDIKYIDAILARKKKNKVVNTDAIDAFYESIK